MAQTRSTARAAKTAGSTPAGTSPAPILLDPCRAFVFPNRIREQRRRHGFQKLMALSERLADIPYIRLSKVERGEVVARADELVQIGRALGVAPLDLLVDIDEPGFDIARWAEPFQDARPWSEEEERIAVLVGATLRMRRNDDRSLTIAALDQQYGLPAVILSRIENAQKTLDRWNVATIAALCRLLDVPDEAALRGAATDLYRRGALDGYVGTIANPEIRRARTRQRVNELVGELSPEQSPRSPPPAPPSAEKASQGPARFAPKPPRQSPPPALQSEPQAQPQVQPQAQLQPPRASADRPRELAVFGAPLPGGLIADTATETRVAAPRSAGPRAFGLRVCRATLGPGLPAAAIVVVDPDRLPSAGGLAAIRSDEGYRLVTVTYDRAGAAIGYSVTPDLEINLDDLDPADLAAVTAAIFP